MGVDFHTTSNTNNGYGMTREYFKKFLPQHGINFVKDSKVALVLNTPPAIQNVKNKIKVLYTMIEGDTVPDSWCPFLDQADHIIVPSNFCKRAFSDKGYFATVIPLGYDEEVFTPVYRNIGFPYKFLHYEAFQDRKGWKDLLDSWMISGLAEEEFECQLILKTVLSAQKVVGILEQNNIELPYNVKLICGELPHHAIFDLLASVDCFVYPSRGEGFSLPPIEAMATGLPTIISRGHSHLDYYDENYMYGVSASIRIPAKYDHWESQGSFVRCNVDDLAKTLRHVYENKEEARNKGLASVEYVSEYGYIKSSKKLADYLCKI